MGCSSKEWGAVVRSGVWHRGVGCGGVGCVVGEWGAVVRSGVQ